MKKITVTITKDAKVTIETSGYSGTSCLEATRAIEEALGQKSSDDLTPEAYSDVDVDQSIG